MNIKILIVDDSEQNLQTLQVLLQRRGYEVTTAIHGIEALEKARYNPPDIVISDILMPVMDGFTLCRQWKADDQLNQIPLVFYTATYTDPKDEEFTLSLGAERFVIKPVKSNELVEMIQDVTEKYESGQISFPSKPVEEETVYLREYNETLIRKLEDMISRLEQEAVERRRVEDSLRKSLAQLTKKNRYETIISTVTRSVHQSLNLQDVLENAVESMKQNIDGVDNVSIYLVEGEEAVIKAYRGYPEWFIEVLRRIPYPKGFTWKTIIDGKPLYCPDVDQDTTIGPAGRKMGTKSYASMPIYSQGRTVGVININSLKKNSFDEDDLRLLEIIARQIESAINNAKQAEALKKAHDELEVRVQKRTEELLKTNLALQSEITERKRAENALKENLAHLAKKNRYETIIRTVTQSVHQSLDLQGVLENAVESLDKNIDLTESVSIYLVEGKEAVLRAYKGYPDWFIKREFGISRM